MAQFLTLILMAIIVEGLITYTKAFFVGGKPQWQMLVGIVLGVTVALVYNVDIFAMLGIVAAVPFVGAILTGILISRGSNYIFDLVKALQSAGGGKTVALQDFATPLIDMVKQVADEVQQATSIAVNNNTASNPPTVNTAVVIDTPKTEVPTVTAEILTPPEVQAIENKTQAVAQ